MKSCLFPWICSLALVLPLVAQDNLLKNPGFETIDSERALQPADWAPFSDSGEASHVKLEVGTPKEGVHCLRLSFESGPSKFYGVTQKLAVKAGQELTFAAYFKNISLRDDSYVQLSLEWVGGDGKEISRAWGPTAKATDISTDEWRKFELTATAPEGTVDAIVVVTLFPAGGSDGSFLIDDLNLYDKALAKK
jgi:hypothetical protein